MRTLHWVVVLGLLVTGCPRADERPMKPISASEETDGPGEPVVRVNCGLVRGAKTIIRARGVRGWAFDQVMEAGREWGAVGGNTVIRESTLPIHDTQIPQLYRSERFSMDAYEFMLPSGTYAIRLHFCETFDCHFEAGLRVFDVAINGEVVLPDLDAFALGEGLGQPVIFEITGLEPVEGKLRISFTPKKGNPSILGLEVFRTSPCERRVTRLTKPRDRSAIAPIPDPPAGRSATKILFVGNSHTFFWNLPKTIRALLHTGPVDVWIDTEVCVSGGKNLAWHWKQGEAPQRIREGGFDYVVLQEASKANDDEAVEDIRRFDTLIRESGAQTLLYCIWNDPTFHTTQRAAEELGVCLIPVGHAWHTFGEEHPGIRLVGSDGHHAGMHGSFLSACVFYAALSGQSPEGHPHPTTLINEVRLDDRIAGLLEQAAWEAVQKHGKRLPKLP
jgi:malectin (di-glucose binding ER protein)